MAVATLAPLRDAWAALPLDPEPTASLGTSIPVACAAAPATSPVTLALTYLPRQGHEPRTRCWQGADLATLLPTAAAALAQEARRGALKVDAITTVQDATAAPPGLADLLLRPGQEGLCLEGCCLLPWQLIGDPRFRSPPLLPSMPDVRTGTDTTGVGALLAASCSPTPRGPLQRIQTASYLLDRHAQAHELSGFSEPERDLTTAAVADATATAQRYLLRARRPDGYFYYMVYPYTGVISFDSLSVARQAGATLALCELGTPGEERTDAVVRSLALLATLERRVGELGLLTNPDEPAAGPWPLIPSTLALAAFVRCRSLVDSRHDALIGRLAALVQRMQRPDGGFFPRFSPVTGAPVAGPSTVFEGGQAVLALALLEATAPTAPTAPWPAASTITTTVTRAMDYYAHRYWQVFAADFFHLEEHWHCLAARAAQTVHPHAGYERLCFDFVASRTRFVLRREDGVEEAFVGGLGFGNLAPPATTQAATFGEALAAAVQIKQTRGLDGTAERETLTRVLRFLRRQQVSEASCFACRQPAAMTGAFAETSGAPHVRVDYVQHAWAALGHGAHALGLLPEARP